MTTHTTKTAEQITADSVLTKRQVKTFGPRFYRKNGTRYRISAEVRYDDRCGNGHNTFSITGTIDQQAKNNRWFGVAGGCIHDDIARHFPELAPLIKWHLCSSDGPMYYIENTVYHAKEHGPKYAWVYYRGPSATDPLKLGADGKKERLLGYIEAGKARAAEGVSGYTVKWNEKTAKTRNLDHARASAIWPDATDAELMRPEDELKAALLARLPGLLAEFRTAVESLGFTW